MPIENNSRRNFLTLAGTGVAGAALGVGALRADTTSSRSSFNDLNVRTFGALGDGTTIDSPAIDKAIAAASASGGGTVRFPAGTYLSYTIHLKSKVTLYLDQGAVIVAADFDGSNKAGGYDLAEPNQWDQFQDYGHSHWKNSLIYGEGLESIAIVGPGLIWGKGLSKGYGPGPVAEKPGVGNKSISLKNCRNVTLRDFSMLHGGHFAILATGVDNFTLDNLTIDTNRDGMDIDCCRNVRVSNCSVNSPWDDGICLKSSFGLGYARSTEMVTITNCFVTGGYEEGTLLDASMKRLPEGRRPGRTGRIKFGTESNGGFKNITISNCVFDTCQGLALETVDGALLEDVTITNITMRDIVSTPIFLRLGSRMRGPKDVPVGKLRRVTISNIVASNCASRLACIVSGIPGHEIEDVKLSDIYVQHQGGGTSEEAAIAPPEKEDTYPEPGMFGPMPAHGFFIRHAKGIEMTNIEITYLKEDARPVFVLNDVQDIDLLRIKTQHAASVPTFALNNVSDFHLYLSRPLQDTHLDHADQKKI
ncbi:MAG TPA: glycoside hydrolase family 28 protein [Terriglobales bacterium]|jgi:polygalacturonase|nr:glycoside hydrolase family 28 protein [Terriglobales bacterium]